MVVRNKTIKNYLRLMVYPVLSIILTTQKNFIFYFVDAPHLLPTRVIFLALTKCRKTTIFLKTPARESGSCKGKHSLIESQGAGMKRGRRKGRRKKMKEADEG